MKTILKIYMYAIMIGVTLGIAFIIHITCRVEVSGADLVKCPVCEVCPSCKITASKIIKDNPAIDLPDGLIKFRYKDKIYTKSDLEKIK